MDANVNVETLRKAFQILQKEGFDLGALKIAFDIFIHECPSCVGLDDHCSSSCADCWFKAMGLLKYEIAGVAKCKNM